MQRNIMKALSLLVAGMMVFTSIHSAFGAAQPARTAKVQAPAAATAGFTGTVVETMNAGQYTYVQVDTGAEKIWAAAPQFAVKKGEKVTVPSGIPMRDYYSKTLDRTFETVYFVGEIGAPGANPTGHPTVPDVHAGLKSKASPLSATVFDLKGIQKPEGGRTVSEIYAGKSDLANKKVSLRGRVVKYNPGIMDKNWIHVQDGTGTEGANDLTVTTSDTAKLGDLVLVQGTIALNKDFGYGYKYDIMLENAKVTVEPSGKP
jgi:hypothetical protein